MSAVTVVWHGLLNLGKTPAGRAAGKYAGTAWDQISESRFGQTVSKFADSVG